MGWIPGAVFIAEFVTAGLNGAAVNADVLPTAVMAHNGTDDNSVTLVVTNIDTGRYSIMGSIPSGYAAEDSIAVVVTATVATVAGIKFVVYNGTLSAAPVTVGAIAAAILATPAHLLVTDASGAIALTSADQAELATAAGYTIPSVAAIAAGIFAEVVFGSFTFTQLLEGITSVLFGKNSGMATTTNVFRDVLDTKNIITATTDANGDRLSINFTP